jgi:beta-glucosidase-like glycosyl hydrolase/CubicO group peptidase (beta-lactamase class C family)
MWKKGKLIITSSYSISIFVGMPRFIIFIFCTLIVSISIQAQPSLFSRSDSAWAKKILSKLSAKQKIAQLFMTEVSPKPENKDQNKKVMQLVKKNHVGGLIIMKGDYALTGEWIREFQKNSDVPLLVSIDGEWGISMRIGNTTKFPYQLTMGALTEDSMIYEMGKAIARDCRRIGIHVNFAPVADVNINPKNPVINYRSFGENKFRVTDKALNYALGMQSENVMACAKHFPGHGDTDVDSHLDLPLINKPREKLEDIELYPFEKMAEENVWATMIAHLKVPSLDSNKTTSLSYDVVTNLLKRDMGFQGLVFTDALNMSGATKSSEPGTLELEAYMAGNDILLMSQNIESGIRKIEEYILASSDYRVTEDLNARVFKILLFKHKLKTFQIPPVENAPDEFINKEITEKIYQDAITFISQEKAEGVVILDKLKSTLLISFADKTTTFHSAMQAYKDFSQIRISKNASDKEYASVLEATKNYEQVIIAYHDLSQQSANSYGLLPKQINFIETVSSLPNVLHVWFGNPYALAYFQKAKNVIVSYEENEKTQLATFRKLYQGDLFTGSLPVSVGIYKEGKRYNIYQKQIHEQKDLAADTSFVDEAYLSQINKADALARIEGLCQEIMTNGVAPGGQLYVMHKGREIYKKSFGKYTYSGQAKKVKNSDIYDLASLSKILGTTIAFMKLKDAGLINLTDRVGDFLTLGEFNTVSNITLAQLLTHEAGLTPFIPFYERFNDSNFFNYFRTKPEENFTTEVAKDLFIRDDYKDTMWYETTHRERKAIGSYKYSDLSMYILQRVLEAKAGMSLDKYLYSQFYKPMDLELCYNPTGKFKLERIVPTEYDIKFRLQQVHGYVHDQGCALYGGVCGHAGLFGNAEDVAQIMQMLIQGGKYKDRQYLKPETISLFTSQQNPNSRRGLGFDKPNVENLSSSPTSPLASFATFGHTGYTGTCAWADPFNELVFVFLSNRVYPDASNKKLAHGKYRERLHSLFYLYTKD